MLKMSKTKVRAIARPKLNLVFSLASFASLFLLAGVLGAQTKRAPVRASGVTVFKKQCASCHGEKGEGTKFYQKSLTGDRSISDLAKYISQNMPPGAKKCNPEDAKRVSSFIFDAFYSPLAQAKNSPARVSLSRLTVRQFRNAVCDLIGSFRPALPKETRHGLSAEYFNIGQVRSSGKVLDRIDPEVNFDFGVASPVPAQKDPYQFAMAWQGSLLAEETGEYEFILRTDQGGSMWLNDSKTPLIDAYVKSGNDHEYRASISLLGGRPYPIRLEFTKGVQGVENLDKLKLKPVQSASVALLWRRPKQTAEIIPERCFTPVIGQPVYAPLNSFPPDDRSIGYERGTSVTKAWDEATTSSAIETAGYVVRNLGDISGVHDDTKDRPARLKEFCRKFVERAFRRPLAPEDQNLYIDRQFKSGLEPSLAVKRVVLLTLKSPRFLYREAGEQASDAFDTASKLSFALWDSLPDPELLRAASAGELATKEQISKQAERMVADPKSWFKLRQFLLQWLKVDQYPDIAKDAKLFPDFDPSVSTDLRTSLELTLESVWQSESSDYRQLLLSDKLFLNGRLSKIYGGALPPNAPFQPVSLDAGERSGVLTHPYLMSSFAYLKTSSPIHRGVLIIRNMLGRTLQPPPAAFIPLSADLHPNLTTRERISLQTKPAPCNSCHDRINPLGFALESYDAIGRFRLVENGKKIDCGGSYTSRSGKIFRFNGARELGTYLATSDEAHAAFVEKLFQHLVKQPVRAYGANTLPELQDYFEKNEYSIRKLMAKIVTLTSMKR